MSFAAVGAYFGISAAAAAAATTGIVGAGVSLYGANKQSKAIDAASAQNTASQERSDQSAWANYLMTRGVNPAGAATGTIPTNPQAINSRLPLWANANFATSARGWRKKGSAGAVPNTLTRNPTFAPAAATTIFE